MREFGLKAYRRGRCGTTVAYTKKTVRGPAGFPERRTARGRSDAAIAELPVPRRARRRVQAWARLRTWLSYFLWDTMPDPALFRAAASGELIIRRPAPKRLFAGCWPVRRPSSRSTNSSYSGCRFDRVLKTAVKAIGRRSRRSIPSFAAAMTRGDATPGGRCCLERSRLYDGFQG